MGKACPGDLNRALDNHADALDARHHAQFGDGYTHPLRGEIFEQPGGDMFGQLFQQIEMAARKVGPQALDDHRVINGIANIVAGAG